MARKTPDRQHLTTGRTRRALKVGTLTTQVGGSYLLNALKRPFQSVDERQKDLLDTHLKNAMLIVERSQELKGTFLKLMQMLSMRSDLLPPDVLQVLSVVQSEVPPMPYGMIREQIVADEPLLGEWRPSVRSRLEERGSYTELFYVAARTYNRVEGLPIGVGPKFRRTTDWGRIQVEALGVFRTADPIRWDRGTVGQLPASVSVRAAMMKSLRCRPRILWLHQVTVTLPHSVSRAG